MIALQPAMKRRLRWLRAKQAVRAALRTFGPDAAKGIALVFFLFCAYALTNDTPARLVVMTQGQYDRDIAEARIDAFHQAQEAADDVGAALAPKACKWQDLFETPTAAKKRT